MTESRNRCYLVLDNLSLRELQKQLNIKKNRLALLRAKKKSEEKNIINRIKFFCCMTPPPNNLRREEEMAQLKIDIMHINEVINNRNVFLETCNNVYDDTKNMAAKVINFFGIRNMEEVNEATTAALLKAKEANAKTRNKMREKYQLTIKK